MQCSRALKPNHSPPKIKSVRIVDNPFDDIVPRITAEEKRAQQRAREQAQKEREEAQRKKGAKKWVFDNLRSTPHLTPRSRDTKLLSFGGEDGDEEEPASFKKKPLVRPDCKCQTAGHVHCRTECTKTNIVVDDTEDSIMTTTIPDFVTNISPTPSKGKEKDEGASSKVATILHK